ncbi:MAG: non-hydrolyzing UDP-N-acetylglucosamine 2-epimerase [Gemmatimonadales bacterium]
MLALCFGTRPQVIKASVLLRALRSHWPVMTIDTGQHYDYELNGLLYEQLDIPLPDHCLEVGGTDPAEQTAQVLSRTAETVRHHRPSAVLVIGDTNSTLGCALAAHKEDLPVIHVEAGLRSSEPNLPEEVNRRVVDVMATLLCAPSPASAARLRAEQAPGPVVTTGDVARDVLVRHLSLAPRTEGVSRFALATVHRAAVTSDPDALRSVVQALGSLGMPVLFPLHPRTRLAFERYDLLGSIPGSVSILPPLGYLEAIAAVRDATAVITDSGGLQREAYWLGTPCVTLRSETEWTETVECGANRLVAPLDARQQLGTAVLEQCRKKQEYPWTAEAYGDGHAAERVAEAIAANLVPVSVPPSTTPRPGHGGNART